jgi:hypothetical protein
VITVGSIKELQAASKLRELTVTAESAELSTVCEMRQLRSLSIANMIDDPLAAVIPPRLHRLTARGITPAGALRLPLLAQLESLRVRICCDLLLLSDKCPNLLSIGIQSTLSTEVLMDFSVFPRLQKLSLRMHALYSLPYSLRRLSTFDSNQLVGPVPPLRRVKLYKQGKPANDDHLYHLCSVLTIESILLQGVIPPCTMQQLSTLPMLEHVTLLEPINGVYLPPFKVLRTLTIIEYKRSTQLFHQAAQLTSLQQLTIGYSDLSHAVLHHLLVQLTNLQRIEIVSCPNVQQLLLMTQFPQLACEF